MYPKKFNHSIGKKRIAGDELNFIVIKMDDKAEQWLINVNQNSTLGKK